MAETSAFPQSKMLLRHRPEDIPKYQFRTVSSYANIQFPWKFRVIPVDSLKGFGFDLNSVKKLLSY